jgi:hypothetical protein
MHAQPASQHIELMMFNADHALLPGRRTQIDKSHVMTSPIRPIVAIKIDLDYVSRSAKFRGVAVPWIEFFPVVESPRSFDDKLKADVESDSMCCCNYTVYSRIPVYFDTMLVWVTLNDVLPIILAPRYICTEIK